MTNEKQKFNKIKNFITDSYNNLPKQGVIIVKSVRNGFMVNNISIKLVDNIWEVSKEGNILSRFRQRRTAVIFAALVYKKRSIDSKKLVGLDQFLDICLEDKNTFSLRLKKTDNPVYADRLSRTEVELDLLEQQLQELEKSLSLQ
jgi:hypothetical protein